ncbi:hypothetical protein, partial [Sphingobium lactosutens]|uniref:hypothetical protein n=1 Tax=Sphingobium lactosutens TaxID=522773 RepID=UPI001D18F80E
LTLEELRHFRRTLAAVLMSLHHWKMPVARRASAWANALFGSPTKPVRALQGRTAAAAYAAKAKSTDVDAGA